MKIKKIIAPLIIFILFMPINLFAAEILQIKDSSTLIIGDQNRNYTVKIACLSVVSEEEKNVLKEIESKLPRHTKINLKPKGSKDGILISRIINISNGLDIGEYLIDQGLASNSC
tara:strand:+ start:1235 stop:1579 length:345 start_codon:yes stop_codon:yes gene_type:complete